MADPALLHSTLKRPTCRNDWEEQKAHIRKLWWDDDEPLERVMSFMEKYHHFQATAKQYKTVLKEWNLLKYVPTNEMKAIVKIQARRHPKETEFMVRDRVVPQSKIDRFAKRTMGITKPSPSALSPMSHTPCAVYYITPLPSPPPPSRRDISRSFINSLGFTPGNSPRSADEWLYDWIDMPPDSLPKTVFSSQPGLIETGLPIPSHRAPTSAPVKGAKLPPNEGVNGDMVSSWSKVEHTYNAW
ncbi:hypothetical protein PG990_009498 [Apiospora arundinis]